MSRSSVRFKVAQELDHGLVAAVAKDALERWMHAAGKEFVRRRTVVVDIHAAKRLAVPPIPSPMASVAASRPSWATYSGPANVFSHL